MVAKAAQPGSSSTGGGDRREFDCTLGYRGQDLGAGSASSSQLGGGSGNGTAALKAEAAANQAEDSDDSAGSAVAAPAAVSATVLRWATRAERNSRPGCRRMQTGNNTSRWLSFVPSR